MIGHVRALAASCWVGWGPLGVSATAFTVLKLGGGAYLIYLGLRSIVHARQQGEIKLAGAGESAKRRFLSAFAVTTLNPKSIVFFVAFVPQFISPHGAYVEQCAILLPTFVILATLNAAVHAHIARFASKRLTGGKAQRRLGYGGGVALIGAGALTLGMSRS